MMYGFCIHTKQYLLKELRTNSAFK